MKSAIAQQELDGNEETTYMDEEEEQPFNEID